MTIRQSYIDVLEEDFWVQLDDLLSKKFPDTDTGFQLRTQNVVALVMKLQHDCQALIGEAKANPNPTPLHIDI